MDHDLSDSETSSLRNVRDANDCKGNQNELNL